jgi:hypothetical protein
MKCKEVSGKKVSIRIMGVFQGRWVGGGWSFDFLHCAV